GHLSLEQRLRRRIEDVLVGLGFSEAFTWSLVADDPNPRAVRVPEPMTADQAMLRTTLLQGLIAAARVNVDAGNQPIALFELARVYLPGDEQLPEERWRVGGIAEGGWPVARAAVEALYASLHLELRAARTEAVQLHPGKAAASEAGWFGELHPASLEGDWGVFELDLATLFASVPERVEYADVITFPAARQDIAIVVDEAVEAGRPRNSAPGAAGPETPPARAVGVGSGRRGRRR